MWLSLRSLDERGGAALPAFSADRGDLHRLVEAPFELGVGRAQGATVRSAADDDVEVTRWRTGGDEEPFGPRADENQLIDPRDVCEDARNDADRTVCAGQDRDKRLEVRAVGVGADQPGVAGTSLDQQARR